MFFFFLAINFKNNWYQVITISSFYVIAIDCKKRVCNIKVFFIDEVVYCELGKNQNNINNAGFIKKEEDVIPNKKLLKLEVNSLRKKN